MCAQPLELFLIITKEYELRLFIATVTYISHQSPYTTY